jgi:hypothetical protein
MLASDGGGRILWSVGSRTFVSGRTSAALPLGRVSMRPHLALLMICSAWALPSGAAAQTDLLVAPADAPMYRLSNFRVEADRFGQGVMLLDFQRTREGAGNCSVRGRSPRGFVSIAAFVPGGVESGTMQFRSILGNLKQQQIDLEVFFVQTHNWGDGKTGYAVVSNPARLGNPGPSPEPRAWTKEEEQAYANHKRIMADDAAQKPRKSYPVSIDVPEDSQVVPTEAAITRGVPLQACYSGKWNPLTALSQNEDGSINVRWDDYGPTFDCSMIREELIIKKVLLVRSPEGSLAALPSAEAQKRGLLDTPPKPRKSYPVSIAVPNHSQLVPADASLPAGTRLQACYAGKWNPITHLSENKDGSLNVRWDDYGPAFDCSMNREELIIRKSALQELQQEPKKENPPATKQPAWRMWTDTTGKFTVRAQLLRRSDTSVTLLTEAGREVTLPTSKLSEADREFLRTLAPAP